MPDVFLPELLTETATYWPVASKDGAGKPTFGSPVAITCRWAEKTELFVDKTNKEVRSRAIVHVDRDLALDGFLYHGTSESTTPNTLEGALPIRGFQKTPGLEGEVFERKAIL